MNKIIISTVIACGLLLLDSPEAAAHEETYAHQRSHSDNRPDSYYRNKYGRRTDSHGRYRDSYRREYHWTKLTRAKKMPRWLEQDRSFRRWYEHTQLRRDRHLSWSQLFDIYRWEHYYVRYRRH